MRKPSFVPTSDMLETRVVLSSGPRFSLSGAAILTEHALGQTYAQVERAFNTFAQHGENYQKARGQPGLGGQPHPLEQCDGLLTTVESEVAGLRSNMDAAVPKPVIMSMQSTLNDVHDFVEAEVADGIIAVR